MSVRDTDDFLPALEILLRGARLDAIEGPHGATITTALIDTPRVATRADTGVSFTNSSAKGGTREAKLEERIVELESRINSLLDELAKATEENESLRQQLKDRPASTW